MQFRFVGSIRRLYSAQLAKPPDRLDRTCVGMRRTARQYSTEQQLVTTCLSVCGHAANKHLSCRSPPCISTRSTWTLSSCLTDNISNFTARRPRFYISRRASSATTRSAISISYWNSSGLRTYAVDHTWCLALMFTRVMTKAASTPNTHAWQ